ncbi:HlyD family type I secretion periplasmic adaptor subunit [Paracoccus sp. 11-3]|uniref:Membrane fusion protein (MFP) family protein n=1 Tax=Paracoccus amoyensis TaxID=2760093 RepID=A0A926JDC5_9RHOB|nr:HlyD family type I secretion periplasmic adaptor subunit [Paracoccus amoyensis]MBC9247434.1 HlyD family type I secretion periplasmic adaptor subunit [Paracoccus amoyensis]
MTLLETQENQAATDAQNRPFGRGLATAGFAIIAVFVGSFYVWAASAPLEGAVIAPGIVSVDTNVRTVQHLEGGIIDQLLVRDGDTVEAGQPLIRLQNTVPASSLNEIQAQYFEARATEARLIAEQLKADKIEFPSELTDKIGDLAVQTAMRGQESIFESRRVLLQDRLTIFERTTGGLDAEIKGLQDQITSSEGRLLLLDQELADVQALYDRKLTDRPRLLRLQREQAELHGEIASYRAAIGTAQQKIEETALRRSELQNSMATEVVQQLRETRAGAYELSQRLAAARDVMGRTEIRSPVTGVVTGLQVHTVGGVISAGQGLMEIVPVSDKLVVQATIDPMDIDQVSQGQDAQVWLSALNRRSQKPIEGIVQTVSADRLVDPQTGAPYYLARVQLDRSDVENGTVPIQPGMSAEVMIHTGARTTLNYLFSPITQFISRGMREG